MEHCRAAERALVAALVMGQADPADLAGRLHPLDFTDPAAGACYAAALEHRTAGGPVLDLPDRLRQRAALRSDGYPIRELLDWLPSLSVPAHPEAWAALVVAGSMGRVVHACGTRLVQSTVSPDGTRPEAGRVVTLERIRCLPAGQALVIARRCPPLHAELTPWWEHPAASRTRTPTPTRGRSRRAAQP
jgi:hypothetical protein